MSELTILVQYVQALLHEQRRVEDDQAIAYRKNIVARSGLEESSDGSLALVSYRSDCRRSRLHTRPSSCSRSTAESWRGCSFGGRGARDCWSRSLGVTKAGRASLGRALVVESAVSTPDMIIALLLGAA